MKLKNLIRENMLNLIQILFNKYLLIWTLFNSKLIAKMIYILTHLEFSEKLTHELKSFL